ncbi:hypothetical protein T4E_6762, partial [Trichinella pseudospiralis]
LSSNSLDRASNRCTHSAQRQYRFGQKGLQVAKRQITEDACEIETCQLLVARQGRRPRSPGSGRSGRIQSG